MSDENTTHFQFRLGGIELEISGDRGFVEQMYSKVMADIEAARRGSAGTADQPAASAGAEPRIVWVHRCTEMMHKIYMSSPIELSRSEVFRNVDTESLGIVYASREALEAILPGGGRGHTIWAELTERGRKKIAEAAVEPT